MQDTGGPVLDQQLEGVKWETDHELLDLDRSWRDTDGSLDHNRG